MKNTAWVIVRVNVEMQVDSIKCFKSETAAKKHLTKIMEEFEIPMPRSRSFKDMVACVGKFMTTQHEKYRTVEDVIVREIEVEE